MYKCPRELLVHAAAHICSNYDRLNRTAATVEAQVISVTSGARLARTLGLPMSA